MEQDDGFGFFIWGLAEVEDVPVWAQAADDRRAGWRRHALAVGADWDFAVIADPHTGLLASDAGPPGAGGGGTEHGTIFLERLFACGVWGAAQFPMNFVLIDVRQELVQQQQSDFATELAVRSPLDQY